MFVEFNDKSIVGSRYFISNWCPSDPSFPLANLYQQSTDLTLPEAPMRDRSLYSDISPPGHINPDSDDPIELVRPLLPAFEALSNTSQIALENLASRAKHLLYQLEDPSHWNKGAEQLLQSRLKKRGPRDHLQKTARISNSSGILGNCGGII